jgi:hypothetical protein
LDEKDDDGISSITTVSRLILAISEGRAADARALVHPDVIWRVVVRPALSQYHGPEGVAAAIDDLRAAYGMYRVEIEDIREDGDGRVSVLAHVVQQTVEGDRPLPPSRSAFRLFDGLVIAMDAEPGGEDLSGDRRQD